MARNTPYLLRTEEYNRLTQNQGYIRESMDYDFMLRAMDKLYEAQLVTYQTHQGFSEISRTTEQAETILDLLISGTSYRYEVFCDFCKEEHPDMYEKLFISDYNAQNGSISTDGSTSGRGDNNNSTRSLVTHSATTRCKSPPVSLIDLDKQLPSMEINVIPVLLPHIIRKASKPKSVYTPSFPVRGIAVLFFNVEFSDCNFPCRTGAEYDMDNLSRLFHDLNYNVKVFRNSTRLEMLKELEFQRQNRDHHRFGSFVLGFSTYGGNKSINCSDGKSVYMQEIYEHFDSSRCPYLAGKPKFIFFDASSGCARDRAVPINKVLEPPRGFEPVKKQPTDIGFSLGNIQLSTLKPIEPDPNNLQPLLLSSTSIAKPSNRVPDKSDFIIALSTFDGYVSWRRDSHGCWFSRILVEVFQKHACDHHLVELLRMIRCKMSYVETNSGYKQVSMTMDTSLKQFYFFPGINSC